MTLPKDVRDRDTTPMLDHKDLPNVVYWTKAEYQKDHKNGKGFLRTISNENSGTAGFLEDSDGVVIDSAIQQDIRDYQRTLWSTLRKFNLAPMTWGRCIEPAQEYCFRLMRTRFPAFRYCEGYWKIDTFMSLYYSQWGDRPQRESDPGDDTTKREGTVAPEFPVELSRTKANRRTLSTNLSAGNCKKSRVETPSVDMKGHDGDSETVTMSSPVVSRPSGFNFKIGHALPGPPSTPVAATASPSTVTMLMSTPVHFYRPLVHSRRADVYSHDRHVPIYSHRPLVHCRYTYIDSDSRHGSVYHDRIPTTSELPVPSVLPNPLRQLTTAMAMQQEAGVVPGVESADENKLKRKRKEPDPNAIMRPSANSKSARNLYPIDWCPQNKGGKRSEFSSTWDTMVKNNDPLVEEYKKRSETVKAAKKTSGGPGNGPAAADDDAES